MASSKYAVSSMLTASGLPLRHCRGVHPAPRLYRDHLLPRLLYPFLPHTADGDTGRHVDGRNRAALAHLRLSHNGRAERLLLQVVSSK